MGPGTESSWFYSLRRASLDACTGDSGGTVWRSGWLSGVVHAINPPFTTLASGQICGPETIYSHVGFMPGLDGITAPVGFS